MPSPSPAIEDRIGLQTLALQEYLKDLGEAVSAERALLTSAMTRDLRELDVRGQLRREQLRTGDYVTMLAKVLCAALLEDVRPTHLPDVKRGTDVRDAFVVTSSVLRECSTSLTAVNDITYPFAEELLRQSSSFMGDFPRTWEVVESIKHAYLNTIEGILADASELTPSMGKMLSSYVMVARHEEKSCWAPLLRPSTQRKLVTDNLSDPEFGNHSLGVYPALSHLITASMPTPEGFRDENSGELLLSQAVEEGRRARSPSSPSFRTESPSKRGVQE